MPNFAASQAACLDFAVTHTQQPNTLQRASVCGGAAAAQYEVVVKDMKFGEQCKAAGLMLVPMVVEVFGTWGERSEEAFKLVSKGCANKASEKAKAAGAHIRRSLSVCLQRLNARILLSRANPLAEVFGEPVDMPCGHDTHSSRADEVAEMVAALDAAPAAMTEAVRLTCASGFLSDADMLLLRTEVVWVGPWLHPLRG